MLALAVAGCRPSEPSSPHAAAGGRPDRELVAAIRRGQVPPEADARFVAAIRRVDRLHGSLSFDAAGALGGDRLGRQASVG